jgi:hypothetical protein
MGLDMGIPMYLRYVWPGTFISISLPVGIRYLHTSDGFQMLFQVVVVLNVVNQTKERYRHHLSPAI